MALSLIGLHKDFAKDRCKDSDHISSAVGRYSIRLSNLIHRVSGQKIQNDNTGQKIIVYELQIGARIVTMQHFVYDTHTINVIYLFSNLG